MTNGQNFFNKTINNDQITHNNIRKIENGQSDDYTNCCLLDYFYFQSHYNLILIDLREQQALNSDPEAIQKANFTRNLKWKYTKGFRYWRSRRNCFRFFKKNRESIIIIFCFNIIFDIKWLNIKL